LEVSKAAVTKRVKEMICDRFVYGGVAGQVPHTWARGETRFFFGEDRGDFAQFTHAMIDYGMPMILGHGDSALSER